MTQDVSKERLERLREDLAALRARTTAELGLPVADPGPGAPPDRPGDAGVDASPARVRGDRREDAPPARHEHAVSVRPHTRSADAVVHGPAPARLRRRPRPPRPPRRLWRPRVRRPSARRAVPPPIPVPRRPPHLAAPRWPVWDLTSGVAVAVVMLPALWQLAHRLLQAMLDTTFLLGADPTRTDFLHAAAGVSGGGLTLALAIVAVAVVKGRGGYLGAALGVVTFFCVFPYLVYTANAGIVSAPVPPLAQMIQPPAWPRQTELGLVFWLAVTAALAAVADLLVRSAEAMIRTLRA